MSKRRRKVRRRLQITTRSQPLELAAEREREKRRLATTKTFRPLPTPPPSKLDGGDVGSRSSSKYDDDDDVQQSDNEYGERQCVCLLLEDDVGYGVERNVNLFNIDIRGAGVKSSRSLARVHKVVLMPEAKHYFRVGRGYGALGSTLYRIGGADLEPSDSEPSFHPTDVWYCDLSYAVDQEKKDKEKKGEFELTEDDIVLRCHGWRRGPSTQGAKPCPVIVSARGMLYALAGRSILGCGWNDSYRAGPTFEVFDPRLREWEALPDPPFASYIYFTDGPYYWGHAVIGDLIFIRVEILPHHGSHCTMLASFHMVHKVWKTYGDDLGQEFSRSPNDDVLVDNLRACCWRQRAPIYNNKMLTCYVRDGTEYTGVFAHNLLTNISIEYDPLWGDDQIQTFPIRVRGSELEDAALIKGSTMTASGYITHLGENKFCLFSPYKRENLLSPYERVFKGYIRACTFTLEEENAAAAAAAAAADHNDDPLLRAEDVIFKEDIPISTFGIGQMFTNFYRWCHVPKPRFSTRSMTFHEK